MKYVFVRQQKIGAFKRQVLAGKTSQANYVCLLIIELLRGRISPTCGMKVETILGIELCNLSIY